MNKLELLKSLTAEEKEALIDLILMFTVTEKSDIRTGTWAALTLTDKEIENYLILARRMIPIWKELEDKK